MKGDRVSRQRHGGYRGVIARNATSETVGLWVVVRALDPARPVGPCPWTPRVQVGPEPNAIVMPAKGDRCLVVFDETGEPWVTVHWPN